MVDDDPLLKPGGTDDQEEKGRTVFGIGLPSAAKPGPGKTGPVPMPRGPAPMAPPAAGRPAPMPTPNRERPRPEPEGPARVDHTLHALPSALLGAVAQATGKPMPELAREAQADATQHDMRVAQRVAEPDDAALRRPSTGEYSATTPDLGQASARVRAGQPATPEAEKPRLRLVAGKPIPGTRYRLLRWLGEGGMGVVYEAEHIDIERRVALKILRTELSERQDTAQVFREEARAAARAGSKNNVEIFDFGELPDGRLFFCMELLSGTDLAAMTEQDIEPGRTIAILRQICKGLGAAHKAGIVHRDIKPENIILISSDGKRDMVKIVDFGVAAILSGQREGGGPIAGTPQYMAPEQISGGDFDARLDIYAMGCMAYEMLVHHPPFPMENLADVLLAQLNTPAPPPLQVRPEAEPKSLAPVIMKCLEKDPANRYANMAELEAAICEAQIAAGIITEWDDLPLPDIDPERRASLVSRMPGANAGFSPPRRRWLWPAVAAVSAAALTGVLLMALGSPDVPPEVVEQIESLSKSARDAASVGNYVTPEGEGDPAIVTINTLEALHGPGEAMADDRGKVLRREFSNQLVTVADKFWDQDATRVLAYEYYDWALIFDGDNAHAAARATRTAAERRDLAERAVAGKLSEGEKSAMMVAQAMVNPDEEARKKRIAGLMASNTKMSLSKKMALEDTVRGAGVELPKEKPSEQDRPPEPDRPATTPEPTTPEPTTPDPAVEDTKAPKKGVTPVKKKGGTDELADGELESSAVKRDPAKAGELAAQGTAALSGGRRSEAEGLFNQAISFDRKCAEALIGLSDIYFDRGSAQKASKYAESAVSVAPNNGTYRLKLGDAYYAALRYKDALTQYEKAQSLGDSKAGPRITKVKAKLGEAG